MTMNNRLLLSLAFVAGLAVCQAQALAAGKDPLKAYGDTLLYVFGNTYGFSELLVRMTPLKYDPNVVQAFLIQVRRDAVGSNRTPLLADHMAVNISPADLDQLAATLQHKVSHGRLYST